MPRVDLIDLTGKRSGARVALEYAGVKRWLTRCDCGREFIVQSCQFRRRAFLCNHSLEARFFAKVDRGDGCWLWLACRQRDGYGSFRAGDSSALAHVFSWELLNGPVPQGLELDHLCRNRRCVRPDHLEPVTHAENVRRGELASATRRRHQLARTGT